VNKKSEDNIVELEGGVLRPKTFWLAKKDPFTLSPMYDYFRHQERMAIYVTGQNYFQFNLTKLFLEDVVYRVKHDMNMIFSVYGQTGTGKSAGSLVLALILSKAHKIKWQFKWMKDTPHDLMYLIKEEAPPRGTVFIMDEQDQTRAGVNAGTMIQMLADLEKRVRKKQWHFVYNSPVPLSHVNHYMLETDGIDRESDTIRFRLYDMAGILHGHIVLPWPPQEVWKYYNDEFKADILDEATQFVSTEEKQINQLLEGLFRNPVFWAFDNNAQRDSYLLMKYPTICRAKTFRRQILSVLAVGSRKEMADEMRDVAIGLWLGGELKPEDVSLIQRLRPSWYSTVEDVPFGDCANEDVEEYHKRTKKSKK